MDGEGMLPEDRAGPLSEEAREAVYRRLTRLMLSCSDFSQAMSAATFLLQEFEQDTAYGLPAWRKFRCYETTLIVAYARPFSRSEGGVPTLGFKTIDVKLTDAERALHERVIDFRNKLYGHSDADAVEMRVLCLHEIFKHNGAEMNLIVPRFDETTRMSWDEILRPSELSSKLYEKTFKKAQELGGQFKDRFRVFEMDMSRGMDGQ